MIKEVLQHDVSIITDSQTATNLSEIAEQEIENMIKDGYSSGQIETILYKDDDDEEGELVYVSWRIVDWRSIALELYNANTEEKNNVARVRFEEEWDF